MPLVDLLADELEELRAKLQGKIETDAAPFRERLDLRSCLWLVAWVLMLGPLWGPLLRVAVTEKVPSVKGRLRDRSLILTFERKGELPVDLVYSGTTRFRIRPDLTTSGDAPTQELAREDVKDLLARLLPIRRLVFGERLIEYDTEYDLNLVTAEEVYDKLDALERLATLSEPQED